MRAERHLVSLDAVRGLAAAAVALPHFFLFRGTSSAPLEYVSVMAVELFFVLSGVVLAPQLLHCVSTGSFREVKTFYIRRWMRTLPPYFVALVGIASLTHNLWTYDFAAYALFIRNLAWIKDANDFFAVSWSLAVEEWFYLIFPVFLVLATRRMSPLAAGCAFLVIFLLLKIAYAVAFPDAFALGRRVVILRVDSICFGFLLSLVLHQPALRSPAAAAGFAFALVLSFVFWSRGETFGFVYAASIGSAGIIVLATSLERMLASISALASFGAKTSYMVYLA